MSGGHTQRESAGSTTALVARISVRGARDGDRGIMAVWRDGRIVWSGDAVQGGPPYRESAIAPARAREILRLVEEEGVAPGTRAFHFGPSATWTHIELFDGEVTRLELGSWHETYEARGRIVATATGIEPLGDRDRDDVLAGQPDDYREFRALWDRLKSSALSLVPADGDARPAREVPWP